MFLVNYQISAYSVIVFLIGFASLGAAHMLWSRRAVPSTRLLMWLEIAIGQWCLALAIEIAATTVPLKQFWSIVAYPGTVFSPVLYFLFATHYARADRDINKRQIVLLTIVPCLVFLAAATNSLHHLVWPEITIDSATNLATYDHGLVFWLFVAYSYTLIIVGATRILRSMVHFARYYHTQLLLLLLASLLPFDDNVIYISGVNPLPGVDWTALGFAFTGLALTAAAFQFKAFTILPIARDILITHMHDCLLVIDSRQRIVDANEASARLLGVKGPSVLFGDHLTEHLPDAGRLLAASAQREAADPMALTSEGATRWYDALMSPLRTPQGESVGQMLILRDITHRKELEAEREKLIAELQAALEEVRTLSGMLPICASCKKIRDDQGYWHGVETYVREHTGAEFSHGLCPDCAQKLYADYFGDEADESTSDEVSITESSR